VVTPSQPQQAQPQQATRALEHGERLELVGDVEGLVASSHLFRSLGPEERERLVDGCRVSIFEEGEVLIREGDAGSAMYLVLEGRVRVEMSAIRGAVPLAELGRGACLGEVSLLTGSPRTATVTALTPVHVAEFPRERVAPTIEGHPRVRELLETLVEGRARDAVEKLIAQ
jgi:CRP-like cAMP-binding protein